MLRALLLVSLCTVISASILPSYVLEYPHSLQRLFGAKRDAAEKKGDREVCKTEECRLIAFIGMKLYSYWDPLGVYTCLGQWLEQNCGQGNIEVGSVEDTAHAWSGLRRYKTNVIKEGMDETVDPCDDFYQYACGNWSNFEIPENRSEWSLWSMVNEKVINQVKEIIESKPEPGDFFAVKLAKNWYHSCMDTEAIEKRGVEPILSTLWRHGGWPLIMEEGEWDEDIYNWQIVDDHFARLLGFNAFHDVRYSRLSYEDNDTVLIDTPHLPVGVERLLSYEKFFSTDSSDENNESGEGSQEKGSKEKGQDEGANEGEDEEKDEENEEEEEEEESKRIVVGRKHKRLGHARSRHNRNRATSRIGGTRRRSKRDVLKHKVHRMLRRLRKPKTHNVNRNVNGKSSKNTAKNRHVNRKRIGKHSNSITHQNKHNNKRKRISDSDNEAEKEEHKKRLSNQNHDKQLSHDRKKNEKRNRLGNHMHGKLKKKSHGVASKAKVHVSKHDNRQKVANHETHQHAHKMSSSKYTKISVPNTAEDTEDEGNDDNNTGTNDDNKDEGKGENEENTNTEEEEEEEDKKKEDGKEDGDDSDADEDNDDDGNESDADGDNDNNGDDSNDGDDDDADDDNDNDDDDEEDDGEDEDNEDGGGEAEDDDDDDEEDEDETRQKLKEVYREHILNVSLVLSKGRSIEVPQEKMLQDIDDLIEFTIKLGELTLMDNDPTPMTLKELQQHYNELGPVNKKIKINWVRKIEKLFAEAGVDVEDDLEITVMSLEYIEKLRALLEETPSRVLVNYVHWLFINKAIMAGPLELRELSDQWTSIFKFASREEICIQLVQLTRIAGYEYVKKYFSEDTAKAGRDMIDDIQKEVEYQIKDSKWMNNDTKHFVLDKLVHMKNWIGYPQWYENATLVKRYFQGLTLGPSFYENLLNYVRYSKWKSLRESVDDAIEEELNNLLDPLELNAFFMPTENSISITAADFQSPFFAYNRPWYVNFGIIGLVMGHEVNHGFDNSGHLYDREGNEMEWLSAMAEAYNKRAACFVDQYNNYSILKGENYTIENYGNQTAGENIADTMGLQTVYRAYKRRERECGKPDPALPGLEKFTNDQTFFLSFATVWCEKVDRESTIRGAKYDVHSPARLRVVGPASNSKEFAKAFNCPAGSPMNPAKKCNIWE